MADLESTLRGRDNKEHYSNPQEGGMGANTKYLCFSDSEESFGEDTTFNENNNNCNMLVDNNIVNENESAFDLPKSLSSTIISHEMSSVRMSNIARVILPKLSSTLSSINIGNYDSQIIFRVQSVYGNTTVKTYSYELLRVEDKENNVIAESRALGKLIDMSKPVKIFCGTLDNIDHIIYCPVSGRKRDISHCIKSLRIEFKTDSSLDTMDIKLPPGIVFYKNTKQINNYNKTDKTSFYGQQRHLIIPLKGVVSDIDNEITKISMIPSCHILKFVVLSFYNVISKKIIRNKQSYAFTLHDKFVRNDKIGKGYNSYFDPSSYMSSFPTFTGLAYFQPLPYIKGNYRNIDIIPGSTKPLSGDKWNYPVMKKYLYNNGQVQKHPKYNGMIVISYKLIQPVEKILLKNMLNSGIREYMIFFDEHIVKCGTLENSNKLITLNIR